MEHADERFALTALQPLCPRCYGELLRPPKMIGVDLTEPQAVGCCYGTCDWTGLALFVVLTKVGGVE